MRPLPTPPGIADALRLVGDADALCLVGIDDALRLAAYETLTARERSWIKATLALAESVYGACPTETDKRTLRAEYGLIRLRRTRPAAWALCVPGAGFASAPRFAAAIMCARLAGVENLLSVWPLTDVSACSPALLTVLELTGTDQAYTLAAPPSPRFWRALADSLGKIGDGRLLYFGARDKVYASLRKLADERGLPLWTDHIPSLRLDASAPPEAIDDAAIRWAHPDAASSAAPPGDACTALYTPRRDAGLSMPSAPNRAALTLGAGLEGCWLHPDLAPGFFLTRQTAVLPADIADMRLP